jgi:hypothetical protein
MSKRKRIKKVPEYATLSGVTFVFGVEEGCFGKMVCAFLKKFIIISIK